MSRAEHALSAPTPSVLVAPGTRVGRWMAAIRPKTLSISAAPVLVGAALAWRDAGAVAPALLAATLIGALLIQIGTNLHNDAADHERGADTPSRRLGPPRATAEGWLAAHEVRFAAMASFLSALAIGCYLIVAGGWPIAALGLACVLAALGYSGGPRPVSHLPVGELFVLAFFGVSAVGGAYYLQCGALGLNAVLAGGAIGLPAAAVLLVNNHRDRVEDVRDGRRTLAIVLGERASVRLYAVLLLAPYALLPWLAEGPGAWGWLPLACLPWAVRLGRRFAVTAAGDGETLNAQLADTARYQLGISAALAAGWLAPLAFA